MRSQPLIAAVLFLSLFGVAVAAPDESPSERRERLANEHSALPGRMLQQLIARARKTPLALRDETGGQDDFFDDSSASATWAYGKQERLRVEVTLRLETEPGVALARLEEQALDAPRISAADRARERRYRSRGLPTEWLEMNRRLNDVVETQADGRKRYPPTGSVFRMPRGARRNDLYQDLRRGRRTHQRLRAERGWLLLKGVHRERHGAGSVPLKTPDGEIDEVHPGTATEGELRLEGLVLAPKTSEVAVHIRLSISYGQVDDARAPHFGKGLWPKDDISKPEALLRIAEGRVPLEKEFLALFETLAGPIREEATPSFAGLGPLAGVWFEGRHLTLIGTRSETVGRSAQALEDLHARLSKQLRQGDRASAVADVTAYEKALAGLGAAIASAGQAHPQAEWSTFECRAFLRGLPTDDVMADLSTLEALYEHWREMGVIARGNVRDIGRLLVEKTERFSANVLKSVVKNYVNWAGAVPAAPERIATLLGERAALTPWDLPRAASSWIAAAERDASILTDQQRSIAELERLLAFYGERDKASVRECERLLALVRALEPVKALQARLRKQVEWLDWASWRGRRLPR